jgi:hypothetical protein
MKERYRGWVLRRARTAQCSPALVVLGMLVALGVVIYIYRELILRTIEIALLAAFTVAAVTAAIAVTLNTIKWYRRRTAMDRQVQVIDTKTPDGIATVAGMALATGDPESAIRVLDAKPYDAVSAEADSMAGEADWLSAEEVDLAIGRDGKLKVRDSRG